VLALTVALTSAYSMLGYVYGTALIAPTIALYAVVVEGGLRRAVLPAVVAIVVLTLAGGILGPYRSFGGAATVAPFELLVAVGLGLAAANRKAYLAEAHDRARQAERSREEEARRRVDAERLPIARELHDVVAHTMATISVQAAAAAHVLTDPAQGGRRGDRRDPGRQQGRAARAADDPQRAAPGRRPGPGPPDARARRPGRAGRHGPRQRTLMPPSACGQVEARPCR
jgi:glucose-6-phosphate-specific signal transduction histidine kinase